MKKKQIRPQVQPVRREIPRLDPEADRGLSTAQARELADRAVPREGGLFGKIF